MDDKGLFDRLKREGLSPSAKRVVLVSPYERGIRTLSWLAEMPNLTELHLVEHREVPLDVSVVSGLRQLKKLRIVLEGKGPGVDLSGLSQVIELYLGGRRKFTGMDRLTKVRSLILEDTGRENLSDLACLPSVEFLILAEPLPDLRVLPHWPLRALTMNSCRRLQSLDGVERFPDLEGIQLLYLPKLASLAPLTTLGRLRLLRVRNCKRIDTLEPLLALRGLRYLVVNESPPLDGRISVLRNLDWIDAVHTYFPKGQYDDDPAAIRALDRLPPDLPRELCRMPGQDL